MVPGVFSPHVVCKLNLYTHQIPAIFRDFAKVGDQEMNVDRKPQHRKQNDNEDKEDGGSESLGAKTVHLSTETRPNGRTYMTKK